MLGLIGGQQAGKGGGDVCSNTKWKLLLPMALGAIGAAWRLQSLVLSDSCTGKHSPSGTHLS